jgi:hypothetical protein
MNRETKEIIATLGIGILILLFAAFLYGMAYHHDKAKCLANGGVWSERMSTGDDGFSWNCIYNPHTEVTIK